MCLSLAIDSSATIEVIIITLGTVTDSDTRMYHMLNILTFIQGHTDLNHESEKKCLTVSETFQAMPIKFALKIVRLKVYIIIASPMILTITQGYKCVSNLTKTI